MIKPMLGTAVKEPFNDEDWVFEIKWDGFRALVRKTKKVELFSRNGKLFNQLFPDIVKELAALPGKFILDGEIVIFDKKGRSRFQLLQNYNESNDGTPFYCIFDILSFQGKDITNLPLLKRKEILLKLLNQHKGNFLHFSEHIETFGEPLFKLAKKKGLEGIIAKRKNSQYSHTRSKQWLKIKATRRQEVVIGGFTEPRGSRKYFGSLLVGVYENNNFVYAGHVGTGFSEKGLKSLHMQMLKHAVKKSPFQKQPQPNASITWIRPKIICEVAFTEWTQDGILRHPVFQGLRSDKSPLEVLRETF